MVVDDQNPHRPNLPPSRAPDPLIRATLARGARENAAALFSLSIDSGADKINGEARNKA
jgi:hypothetical protein